jgi:hypothetical protein
MEFRILKIDTDDDNAEKSQKVYFEHLKQFKKSSNTDLWKFFYWDFFHDGKIQSITIGSDLKTVTMKVDAPNIKRLLPIGDFKYVNAGFICTFCNVVHLEMKNTSPEEEWSLNQAESATFLYAEINTSPLLNELTKDEFYSLLIEVLFVDNTVVWLDIVFSQVNVQAEEPLSFSLMESDPKFEIPVYRPEEEEKAS